MSIAKLAANPAEGHGLTSSLVDRIYGDRVAGKPVEHLVVVALLKPVEHGEKDTAKGTHRVVKFEVIRLEPVTDTHDAETVRHLLTAAYDARHTGATLPLDFGSRNDAEQREFLVGLLGDWQQEKGLTDDDIRAQLLDYFGGPDYGPADPSKASSTQLREFLLYKGAIAEDGPTPALADGAGRTEADDDEDDEDGGEVVAFSDSRKAQAGDRT